MSHACSLLIHLSKLTDFYESWYSHKLLRWIQHMRVITFYMANRDLINVYIFFKKNSSYYNITRTGNLYVSIVFHSDSWRNTIHTFGMEIIHTITHFSLNICCKLKIQITTERNLEYLTDPHSGNYAQKNVFRPFLNRIICNSC